MKNPVLAALAASLALVSCKGQAPAPDAQAESRTEDSRAAITDFARMLIVERKPMEAFAKYFAPDIVQHDPWIGDGNKGDEEFLEKRREENPEQFEATEKYVNVIHNIMADGDLVAVKSHVFTSPADAGRVFVDIWRVKDGKFVEHWDVIQPIEAKRANDGAVGCGVGGTYEAAQKAGDTVSSPACGKPAKAGDKEAGDKEANRKLVLDYMAMGRQPGKLVEAINTYLAEDFTQHSGHIPPGRQGLIDYMAPLQAKRAADNRTDHFARTLADGDLVLVHRRVTSDSDPRGIAYADLFRVKNGRITDHWDVIQPIPEFSASGRSMTGGPDDPLEPGRRRGPPPAGAGH